MTWRTMSPLLNDTATKMTANKTTDDRKANPSFDKTVQVGYRSLELYILNSDELAGES
jgi:hypothetical protein